jgi:hypothetical protein
MFVEGGNGSIRRGRGAITGIEAYQSQMYLNNPPWSEDLLHSSSSSSSASSSALPGGVVDLVKSLNKQRLYREITLALRTTLRDAIAEFSFLRVKGLGKLLKFLGSVVESENMIALFRETQTFTKFQVVPVLFHYSIAPSKSGLVPKLDDKSSEEHTKIASPPTSNEVALALQVLEGCCLLDRDSRTLAQQHMAIKEIVRLLSAGSTLVQRACLDALIALMLDSLENQKEFERHHGVRQVAELVKNGNIDEELRLKCAEFLLLVVGNVIPSSSKFIDNIEDEEGREEPSRIESVQDDILELLGEEIASLLWAAGQLWSSIDSERKQSSLQFQAQQLLDCLDSKR